MANAVNNTLAKAQPRQKFSVAIQSEGYKRLIANTLSDPKVVARFTANIMSAVAVNPTLQECDPATILAGGLLGENLKLSPSPQLAQFYLVPFKNKNKNCMDAQFILGYRGLLQLAIRSGYYRKINVIPIKEGELKKYDELNEIFDAELIEDHDEREKATTIGYYAMLEYLNGFRKCIYWSKAKMMRHADEYSKAFSADSYKKLLDGKIPQTELWKYSSFWYKDFDAMACKTMLRQLISKWGMMSTELQMAMESDEGIVKTKDGQLDGVEFITDDEPIVLDATVEPDPLA